MKTLFLLLIISISSIMAQELRPLPITANDLNGLWIGQYAYDNNQYQPVGLAVVLKIEQNGKVIGDILEPNTFGPDASPSLTSKITGSKKDERINLTFTYDGRSGISHSVDNSFSFSMDGLKLIGRWKIGEDGADGKGDIVLSKFSDVHKEVGEDQK